MTRGWGSGLLALLLPACADPEPEPLRAPSTEAVEFCQRSGGEVGIASEGPTCELRDGREMDLATFYAANFPNAAQIEADREGR